MKISLHYEDFKVGETGLTTVKMERIRILAK
jgi:hypothetical protein